MADSLIADRLNAILAPLNVQIWWGRHALNDLSHYPKGVQEQILALILRRAKAGARLKPEGLGEPLHGELSSFSKIKSKSLSLRIIYRPREQDGAILMEVIVIGPRDKDAVYREATRRILSFEQEMRS